MLKSFLLKDDKIINPELKTYWVDKIKIKYIPKLKTDNQKLILILKEIDTMINSKKHNKPQNEINNPDFKSGLNLLDKNFDEKILEKNNVESFCSPIIHNKTKPKSKMSLTPEALNSKENVASSNKFALFPKKTGEESEIKRKISKISKKINTHIYNQTNPSNPNVKTTNFFISDKSYEKSYEGERYDKSPIILKGNNHKTDLNYSLPIMIKSNNNEEIHKIKIFDKNSLTKTSLNFNKNPLMRSTTHQLNAINNFQITEEENTFNEIISKVTSEEFINEEEKENVTIIYKKSKEGKLDPQYMSIDLFLKKIALDQNVNSISSLGDETYQLNLSFIQQYSSFIKIDVLISKLINIFGYYITYNLNIQNIYQNDTQKDSPNSNNIFTSNTENFYNTTSTDINLDDSSRKESNQSNESNNSKEKLTFLNYPKGLVKFVNNYILLKFEDEISSNPLVKEKFQNFYDIIKNNSETFKHFSESEIDSIYDLFNEDNKSEIEYSIKQIKGRKKSQGIISFKRSESLIPKVLSDIFDILQWEEIEIARQLTLTSHNLFSKIEYKELLSGAWTKKEKYSLAPNVMKMIDRFNKLSLWMIEEVLSYDKKKMRAACVEKFLNVAIHCREFNNFNDCVNIVCGLNNFIIKNLKKTWKVMNKEVLTTLEELNAFCHYENNYKVIRNEMKESVGKPCVPYLGLLMKDLAFIEEGPKYVNKNGLINLEKIRNVSNAINFIFQFKGQAYTFRSIDQLSILKDFHPKSEEDIEEMANKIEPIFTLTKTTKKRITNTDSKMYKLQPTYSEFLLNNKSKKEMNQIIQFDDHF